MNDESVTQFPTQHSFHLPPFHTVGDSVSSVSQSAETMTGRTWYRHHHHTSYYYHLLGWHNFRSIKVEKWFLTMPKMLILFKFLYPHSSSGASATVLGRERGEKQRNSDTTPFEAVVIISSQPTNHPPSTLVIHVAKYNNKKNTFSCSYFRFAFIKGSSPSTNLPHSHTRFTWSLRAKDILLRKWVGVELERVYTIFRLCSYLVWIECGLRSSVS